MLKTKLRKLNCTHLIALGLVFGGWALPSAGPDRVETSELRRVASDAGLTQSLRDLAHHYAPAIYQDTDSSYYVGDYITLFNFDGDYEGKNNWENLSGRSTVPAYVYYAVSETETHWFLNYSVFHPRDWHEWNTLDMHENDLEGVSLMVEKGPGFGKLIAMETLAHDVFYQYSSTPGVGSGTEVLDGPLTLEGGSHPRVFSEAKGHGLYGCDSRCDSAPSGDGIVYLPGEHADAPTGGDGNYRRRYSYRLIAMDADGSGDGIQGLWSRRDDICDTCTFGSWGRLRGDNHGTDRAKMPWVWSAGDSDPVQAGDMLCDPAYFFDAHLNGKPFEDFSHAYVTHPFRTHETDPAHPEQRSTQRPYALASMALAPGALSVRGTTREHSYCRPGPLVAPRTDEGPLMSFSNPLSHMPRIVSR